MSDEYAGDDLTGLEELVADFYEGEGGERADDERDSGDGGKEDEGSGDGGGQEDGQPADLFDDGAFGADAFDEEWRVRRMVATMVPLLVGLSVLQMVSGSVLERFEEVLVTNPALLILVPVQIGTAGNLGSIMCARLSTQCHLGTFELSAASPEIRANVGAILGLGLTVFSLVGVAAWGIGTLLGGTLGLGQVLVIALASGTLLSLFVVVVSLAAVTASYRAGLNPDDTTIPVVTNVCDITGVLILFGVVTLVL